MNIWIKTQKGIFIELRSSLQMQAGLQNAKVFIGETQIACTSSNESAQMLMDAIMRKATILSFPSSFEKVIEIEQIAAKEGVQLI